MTGGNHPASSVEFLSRLHDGEVPDPERIAFDEHRKSCSECRAAAEGFEASLAALRASDVIPTPADLSARILRKIRSQSPSRRPFGVMFGIDVRWAGLLVAGLLAVLLSAPLVLRSSRPVAAMRPPISATLIEPPAETKAAGVAQAPASEARRQAAAAVPRTAGVSGDFAERAAPPEKTAALEAPVDDEQRRFAPAPATAEAGRAPAKPSRPRTAAAEPLGGEAGAAADLSVAVRPPVRLLVTSLDGEGEAPAIVDGPDASRLSELRGREFVLTVEASGRVRSIEPSVANGFVAAPNAKTRSSDAAVSGFGPLQGLRFAPGDRPRRLAVRVP
jgi:hypothetical protein